MRRDTTDTNTSLPGIPDLQKILNEQLKTQQLYDDAAAKAANMIGSLATKQYTEATTDAEREFWKEGGTGPTILHAIAGGLLGGVTDFNGMLSGMLGGASSAYLAPKIKELVAEFVKEAGLSGSAADFMTNSITGSILQGLGGVTGGTGAAYAGNAYQNNYLKHEEIIAYNDEMRQCGENPDCQYRVFSEYFEISANRNDEVASCETEECRKAHYDDFMKAKEVANLILNPFNHNNDFYYTALLTLQSNEVNAAVNHIAMARVQARNDAREQCGSDDACTQRYADEYFQLWVDERENKQLLGFAAGLALGIKQAVAAGYNVEKLTKTIPSSYTKNADGSYTGPAGGKIWNTGEVDAYGNPILQRDTGGYFVVNEKGMQVRTRSPYDATTVPIHHVCTNKSCTSTANGGPWTPKFQEFFDNAGLNINAEINKIAVPGHQGPHPVTYHQYVYKELNDATSGLAPGTSAYTNAVTGALNRIKQQAVTPGHQVNSWLTGGK